MMTMMIFMVVGLSILLNVYDDDYGYDDGGDDDDGDDDCDDDDGYGDSVGNVGDGDDDYKKKKKTSCFWNLHLLTGCSSYLL